MAKRKIKNKEMLAINDADVIGILWKGGEKGMLIETKEGFSVVSNSILSMLSTFSDISKSKYLTRKSVKRDKDKVFIFDSEKALIKWFAK